MKSLDEYLKEAARRQINPVTGDQIDFIINQDTIIETVVLEHDEESVVLDLDEECQTMLEDCGCEFTGVKFFDVFAEAEYKGKKVKLNDPIRTSENPKNM